MNILQITVILVISMGFEDDQLYEASVMVVAFMYPASRIVVKPINGEYTSILDTKVHSNHGQQKARKMYSKDENSYVMFVDLKSYVKCLLTYCQQ